MILPLAAIEALDNTARVVSDTNDTLRVAMPPDHSPLVPMLLLLLFYLFFLSIIIFVIYLIAKYIFCSCKEKKLTRIELGKLAEEVKEIKQLLKK